jgi:hypothetical protein
LRPGRVETIAVDAEHVGTILSSTCPRKSFIAISTPFIESCTTWFSFRSTDARFSTLQPLIDAKRSSPTCVSRGGGGSTPGVLG